MQRLLLVTTLFLLALTGCPEESPVDTEEPKEEPQGNETPAPVCGDGEVTGNESCDDGNTEDGDACTNACTVATCGDGVTRTDVEEGEDGYEACDDGNDDDKDACTSECIEAVCGDGITRTDLEEGEDGYEICDDANDVEDDNCTSLCLRPACGDGILQESLNEACDDGNTDAYDACTDTCQVAICGDGILREDVAPDDPAFETCDDGNAIDIDECSNACRLPVCGDGIVQAGEQCDDGNSDDDDGCFNSCEAPEPTTGVIDLQSFQHHTCALFADGAVKCWGANNYGQLGVAPSTEPYATPQLVEGLPPVVELSVGFVHNCARTNEGDVWCWGSNRVGQIGAAQNADIDTCTDNDVACSHVPNKVEMDTKALQVSVGANQSCVVDENNELFCWGDNALCQLGTGGICGEDTDVRWEPFMVLGMSDSNFVAAGAFFTCATVSDLQTVRCWGSSIMVSTGVLGNGTNDSANEPMDTNTIANVSSLYAGVGHVCGRQDNGNVWCWGGNGMGQVGTGEEMGIFAGVSEPALVLTGTMDMGRGAYHTCAIMKNYTLKCWGMNMYGQIGGGEVAPGGQGTDQTLAPTPAVAIAGVYKVAAGEGHTCALTYSGKVYCWGDNQQVQCAHEEEDMSLLPVEVLGL